MKKVSILIDLHKELTGYVNALCDNKCSDAGTGGQGRPGAGGPLVPSSIFSRSVNPIPTGGGNIISTYYYWPPNFFQLPASLIIVVVAYH